MFRSRRRFVAPALGVAAAILCALSPAQGNFGVVISEAARGTTGGGPPTPAYIELVNLQIANPVLPVPINLAGTGVGVRVGVGPPVFITIPSTVGGQTPSVGGNVQPPPAAQPPVLPPPAVFLISEFAFPTGTVPANVIVLTAPALFTGANALFMQPGVPTEICVSFAPGTGINQVERFASPPAIGSSVCGVAGAYNMTGAAGAFQNTNGRAIRWTYVDSNTDFDFDGALPKTPGAVNPDMTHVDGLEFGPAPGAPVGVGLPINVNTGALSLSATGAVVGVRFFNPQTGLDRIIAHPAFDAVLQSAVVALSANYTVAASTPGTASNMLPGLTILNELHDITVFSPTNPPATLSMPMGVSQFVFAQSAPNPVTSTQQRLERIYTDMQTDSAPTSSGPITQVQLDVLPGSTGGGNVWCEVVVYDSAGNMYRAKVKNWPATGSGQRTLALGTTPGSGEGTLIDFEFPASAFAYHLFSATDPALCPFALIFGLCPDALFLSQLAAIYPYPSPPVNIQTDVNGVYAYYYPAGTFSGLVGQTFWGVAVDYTNVLSLVASNVADITF